MHLERALRLSPREAQLWYAMAKIRFEQGNNAQAVQFCLKSNSLAGRNRAVIRRNWLLMEKAYLKTGEKEKAAQARQKAGE
jgi:cytochrome c-type biogenesis protein CcmH/NrfG